MELALLCVLRAALRDPVLVQLQGHNIHRDARRPRPRASPTKTQLSCMHNSCIVKGSVAVG